VPTDKTRPRADDDDYKTLAEVLKDQRTQSTKTSKTKSTTTTGMAELEPKSDVSEFLKNA